MNNLDLLLEASIIVESEKLHVMDKFSAVGRELKSSIGGRVTGWKILQELLRSGESTILSRKERKLGPNDPQLKRYLEDYDSLIASVIQIYTQEAELLHAVKREIIDVFVAKNEFMRSGGNSAEDETKLEGTGLNNQPAPAAGERQESTCGSDERCEPNTSGGADYDDNPTKCRTTPESEEMAEPKAKSQVSVDKGHALKIRIPVVRQDGPERRAVEKEVPVKGTAIRTRNLTEPCSKGDSKDASGDVGLLLVEKYRLSGGSGADGSQSEVGAAEKATVQSEETVASRVPRRHRKRRSFESEGDAVPSKRRRINWTQDENRVFIGLVRQFQPLGEMEMRRRLARHFSPRRTHEQCANHLRILRAKGVLPPGGEAGGNEGGGASVSADAPVTRSKGSQ